MIGEKTGPQRMLSSGMVPSWGKSSSDKAQDAAKTLSRQNSTSSIGGISGTGVVTGMSGAQRRASALRSASLQQIDSKKGLGQMSEATGAAEERGGHGERDSAHSYYCIYELRSGKKLLITVFS